MPAFYGYSVFLISTIPIAAYFNLSINEIEGMQNHDSTAYDFLYLFEKSIFVFPVGRLSNRLLFEVL